MTFHVALVCVAGAFSLPSALLMFRRDARSAAATEMTLGAAVSTVMLGTAVSNGWLFSLSAAAVVGLLAAKMLPGRRQRLPLLAVSVAALLVYAHTDLRDGVPPAGGDVTLLSQPRPSDAQ